MKKIFILFLSIIFIFCGCTAPESAEPEMKEEKAASVEEVYVKSIWITYYELNELIGDCNEKKFTDKIRGVLKSLSEKGFNTVTVQVRAFADAFYASDYFPVSKYCFGEQGGEMKYDVLKIFCELAAEYNMNVEAWVNPYRVSSDKDINKLSDNNIAKKWYKKKKTKSYVYVSDSGIYFNPASDDVTQLIVNGVAEIAKNYSVSAIHFDDYFYPSTDKAIDKKQYGSYKEEGGKLSLADFRRDRVSNMIQSVYEAIKSVNKDIKFGISPASNIKNDYNTLYADVEKWAGEDDYCDYICPQIYFGFRNIYQPFMFTTKKWIGITNKDLYVGLPLYKAGKKDKYAAEDDENALNEFKTNSNIISRQITYLSKIDDVKGFYIFSYSSLSDKKCSQEVENMIKAMQNSNPD